MAPSENMLSVSEAARRLDAKPRDLTNLFYKRQLKDSLCPIIAGRRAIPESYLEVIAMELRRNQRACGFYDPKKGASQQ